MRILKFGGSSLATPARVRAAAAIVRAAARREPAVVVVSAFGGVTDRLIRAASLAASGDDAYRRELDALRRRHLTAARKLAAGRGAASTRARVVDLLDELRDVLHGIRLLGECSRSALDLTVSFGERLSATIVAAHLRAAFVDARELIVADDHTDPATVLFEETGARVRKRLGGRGAGGRRLPVVTGFIASTPGGRTTTLGRDGSDYTAAILGGALKASRVEIWTDVAGVLSADPRAVPEAFLLRELSYEEAMELSYFGASVLHAAAIAPAVAGGIPIHIRNTLDPEAPGTVISARPARSDAAAKGISSIDGTALLTLRGPGMVGVHGIAQRLFGTLATARVNVILISQASSEHTVCFAVRNTDVPAAVRAIHDEFRLERGQGLIALDTVPDQTIVAVVGEGMKGRPGVSGKVFDALGRHQVNVAAIAQGASERNISFVVDGAQKRRALNVIHQAFFAERKRLWLFVAGTGTVGSALLRQLAAQRDALHARGIDLRLCGAADSRRLVLRSEGLEFRRWKQALARSTGGPDPARLAPALRALDFTNVAVVDCTASEDMVNAYASFAEAGVHVVTPNKLAVVLPWPRYRRLMERFAERRRQFLFEATVGAGMPVISTLQDLTASGDTVHRIEGVLSGTLSYLLNRFDGMQPFSELVRDARRLGYTEPDPREDLSGRDVARKLLILARVLGRRMNLGDIRVENLVPESLRSGRFTEGFHVAFARGDARMAARLEEARSHGRVLRYVGTLTRTGARAGLKAFPMDHPFARVRGSDNMIVVATDRYSGTPLVLQGAGAGADVTAMGVFSDILKLANTLP